MSGQAMHRVVVYGPDDPRMFRLLIAIADFADPAGNNATVGLRLLAERSRLSVSTLRTVLCWAVAEGWVTVGDPGGGRRRAVYHLGKTFEMSEVLRGNPRAARGSEHEIRADLRAAPPAEQPEHAFARAGTSNVIGRKDAQNPRPEAGGVLARAQQDDGHPPQFRTTPPSTADDGPWTLSEDGPRRPDFKAVKDRIPVGVNHPGRRPDPTPCDPPASALDAAKLRHPSRRRK